LKLRIWTGIISLAFLSAFFAALCIAAPAEAASVHIAWTPSNSKAVVGYKVHYGDQPGFYTNVVRVDGRFTSNAVIGSLEEGKTYFFTVTAFTAGGKESAYSEEISNEKGDSLSKQALSPTASPSTPNRVPRRRLTRGSAQTQASAQKIPPSRREAKTAEGKIIPSRSLTLEKKESVKRGTDTQ